MPRRDRGAAVVGGLVTMFALAAGAFVWLARDVDRTIGNRADAQSIAFQSARAGAQALDEGALRSGEVRLDPRSASTLARDAAQRLLDAHGSTGQVLSVVVDRDRLTVAVRIDDGGRPATGTATVRARRGVTGAVPG